MRKGYPLILIVTLMLGLWLNTFATPVSAQVLPREKTLYVDIHAGRVADPTNWNPYIPGVRRDQGFHQLMIENLFYVNLETGEYIPWLAESYEYKEDYTKLVVKLRRGVEWNDGKPFKADDVVFTYDMIMKTPGVLYRAAVMASVESVSKIDDYTVEFKLKTRNPRFHLDQGVFPVMTIWGGMVVVPKHIWEGKDASKYKFTDELVWTGPYKLLSKSETVFVYERRDDWWATKLWGIRPAPKYVVFVYYGLEEAQAIRLAANEIDQANEIMPGTLKPLIERNPYVQAWYKTHPYAWLDPCPRYLKFNLEKYPWSLREVRWAISRMINRTEIVNVALERAAPSTWGPFPYYAPLKPYFDAIKDLIAKYAPEKFDPEEASRILTGLGFTKGPDGIWVTPNGTRLSLVIYTYGPDPTKRRAAAAIAEQLKMQGIDATWKPLEAGPYGTALLMGDYEAIIHWNCPGGPGGALDPVGILMRWWGKYYKPTGVSTGGTHFNTGRYMNPAYDAILEEMTNTPTTELDKLTRLFRDIMEIWFRDLPGIPIWQAIKIVPQTTYYWTGWSTSDNPRVGPHYWWMSFLLELVGYRRADGTFVPGLRPRTVHYTTVYITDNVPKFRGIDQIWYGPFKKGDAARIPDDDAEFLVKMGLASLSPILPTLPAPELEAILREISGLRSDTMREMGTITRMVEGLTPEIRALANNITLLTIVAAVEGIIILVLAVGLMRGLRWRREEEE